MNAAAAIAKHFKVNHWQVVRVEEWAKMFFAVVKGLGARFVSKKVAKVAMEGYKDLTSEQFDLVKSYFLKNHQMLDGGIFGNAPTLSPQQSCQLKQEIGELLNQLTKSGVRNPLKYPELDPRSKKYQPTLNPVK